MLKIFKKPVTLGQWYFVFMKDDHRQYMMRCAPAGWFYYRVGFCRFHRLPDMGEEPVRRSHYSGFVFEIAFWLPFTIRLEP